MSNPTHFKSWETLTAFLNTRRNKQLRVSYATYMRLRDNRIVVYSYTSRQKPHDEWVATAYGTCEDFRWVGSRLL